MMETRIYVLAACCLKSLDTLLLRICTDIINLKQDAIV